MTKTLTRAEWRELRQESIERGEVVRNCNGFDLIQKYQHRFSNNFCQMVELRPGLHLEIIDNHYYKPFSIESLHSASKPLISKFYLSGIHRVLTPGVQGVKGDYEEGGGQNYLFFLPDIEEIEQWQPKQRLHLVRISIQLDIFRAFSTSFESLPNQLQQLIENNSVQRFHQPLGVTTHAMQVALQQILSCPYQGMTKRMYLESKTLELLALQLTQWVDNDKKSAKSSIVQADDMERLHHAKEILIQNLEFPPSLQELAQQVGLNDYKLKRGFREVFGTTVFGCLLAHRMEMAKQLLAEQGLSVASVARAVGYASQSRFCHAFKRQFGITPKSYRTSLH